jgi:hypothetical protein
VPANVTPVTSSGAPPVLLTVTVCEGLTVLCGCVVKVSPEDICADGTE